MAGTSITVSYSGVEKRVPLAVEPSIELSDDQVNSAEMDLHNKLRELFHVPSSDQFYLHEAETSRVMSKESFREFTVSFPSHWYLVSSGDPIKEYGRPHQNGLENDNSHDDLMATLDMALPPEMTTPPSDDTSSEGPLFDDEEEEEEEVLQLAELTALPEQSYSTHVITSERGGAFGLSLRHFTIQSDSNQYPDTPLEDYERPLSRLSNESLELKLSTTFIFRIVKGGVAHKAGLEEGMVLHMINGTRIIRSSVEEIRDLIGQCGEELTLLTLSKEHDDLQFLYPRYTYGPSGEYSTKDGLVTATDIKVVCGKDSPMKSSQAESKPTPNPVPVSDPQRRLEPSSETTVKGVEPPSGMMVFNDTDSASQDNSQSCDPRPPRQPPHDDVLVEGSLEQIMSRTRRPLTSYSSRTDKSSTKFPGRPPPSNSSTEWYNDTEEFSLGQDVTVSDQIILESSASDSNFLAKPPPLPVRVRTRSNSSLEAKPHAYTQSSQSASSPSGSISSRTALASSMSALDHLSRYPGNYKDRARSTDLGRFKIKRKGDKSLEGLTRIASDGLQQRLSIRPISTEKKKEEPEVAKPEPPSWSSGPAQQMSQSSKHSNESSSSLLAMAAPRKKVSSRGYQSQRNRLHSRSRSKVPGGGSVGESLESGLSSVGLSGWGRQGQRSPSTSQENDAPATPILKANTLTPDPNTPPTLDEPHRNAASDPRQSMIRNHSQNSGNPLPTRPRLNRPMSAVVEPTRILLNDQNFQNPFSAEPPKKVPIYKTRSIGEQVFREVNIEDAIAASQTGNGETYASQGDRGRVNANTYGGRSQSIDASSVLANKKKGKRRFGRKQGSVDLVDGSSEALAGLGKTSAILRLSSEVLNTMGLPSPPSYNEQTNIQCHGVLSKKQDLLESGKRAGDRSWHSYYAVLASNRISFYRDRKEARLRAQCDEPPIDVVPSKTDFARSYNKKKFVFRVTTEHGAVYLLQASDAPSLKNWVTTIQDLNGGPPTPEGTLQRSKDSDSKLAPPSPSLHRRAGSPHFKGKKKEEGSRNFLDKLKHRLRGPKDEPDFSSYVTFGQPLEECPASLENKKVPLVVEYCVKTVEELGLDVEGIYRKPGHTAMIKFMSSEMDKGVYEFTEDAIGDVHTVASLFKKFFKELPDPMIPESAHEQFIMCARMTDEEQRIVKLKELVFELPMAHYHTLRYLMKHLKRIAGQSELNKMTFRNVALVFGPTLIRGAAEDLLSSMNDSYTIVETLCRHVDHLFAAELCGEEQRALLEREGVEGVEVLDEGVTRGSPVVRHRDVDHKYQRDAALISASPQSLRRVKNNLGDNRFHVRPAEPKRNSLTPVDSTLHPKQPNWDVHTRGANRSVDSGVSSPGDQRSPEAVKTAQSNARRTRHVYEDVERSSRPATRHAYEDVDRTSSWVSAHNEIGWGKREGTGSMWAPQNRRELHKPRKQDSLERERERERELSATVHSTTSHSQRVGSNTLPANPSSPRRRVSYMTAMVGVGGAGGGGGGGPDPNEDRFAYSFTDHRTPTRYSQSSHRQPYKTGRGYDSLQRPPSTTTSSRMPRRGSESGSERMESGGLQNAKEMLLRSSPVKSSSVHRTRSHGMSRTAGVNHAHSGERLTRTASGRQLEPPYLKQSLL